MPDRSTIFALSSGRPPVAIAVIRISGPLAGAALTALGVKIPEPRKAGLARIRNPQTNEIIDEALVLWFPAPHSETGEDVAELQVHGGRAVIAALLDALAGIDGLRMAEAGEFTRRGFENGKFDLTAVEGLADLVNAETEGQRRQAFRQMKGLLGNRAEGWRQNLIKALALVEARIDFSDEADVPEDLVSPSLAIVRELKGEIAGVLTDEHRGERLREGLVVAIAGPPNAGKSTLLNRIAQREAAIVSPYAGTTRDVIEVHLDLGGLPVTLLDTAGIRETVDPVELEGVRRASDRAASADLVLWVVDASRGLSRGAMADLGSGAPSGDSLSDSSSPVVPARRDAMSPESICRYGRPGSASVLAGTSGKLSSSPHFGPSVRLAETDVLSAPPSFPHEPNALTPQSPQVWLVRNKIDLIDQVFKRNELEKQTDKPLKNINKYILTGKSELIKQTNKSLSDMGNEKEVNNSESKFISNDLEFNISATSGVGFDELLSQLERYAASHLVGGEQSLVTRARHRQMLEETLAALERALSGDIAGQEDLLAEELRAAAAALGRLTGRVDVEDVLDVIFRDFCIGK